MSPLPDEDTRAKAGVFSAGDRMREIDLDTAIARRTPPRVRAIQAGALLALLLVVGGLLLRSYESAQPDPVTLDNAPINVAILTNVTYGTLTVNGKKLDNHPLVSVALRKGRNSITLAAPPFRPHTCFVIFNTTLSALDAVVGPDCSIGVDSMDGQPLQTSNRNAPLTLFIPQTGADLPPSLREDAQASLAKAIGAVSYQTRVPIGQYIATGADAQGHVTSLRATERLRATLSYTLAHLPPDSMCDANTIGLCPAYRDTLAALTPAFARSWMIDVHVASQWRFTTADGRDVAASHAYPALDSSISLALQYNAQSGWHIQMLPSPGTNVLPSLSEALVRPSCLAGGTLIESYLPRNSGLALPVSESGIEGCGLELFQSYTAEADHFIWRFGVLLAEDAPTHKHFPYIPIAPQAEIDAMTK